MPRTRKKRASARAGGPSGRALISGAHLVVGSRHVTLHSAAVHYFRLGREAWGSALREVVRMGFPMVETYVPWSVHEVAEGEYDFGERDPKKDVGAFMDLAADLGLLVVARPGPHINAEMTRFGIPERIIHDPACQARSPRQNPVILPFPPEMFPVPSYASNAFHRQVGAWYDSVGKVLAPRLYPRGPIVMLQVDNEASYYFRNAPYDQDYHPDAVTRWRAFLEAEYGSPGAAGEAHGARYATWDDVHPPLKFQATEQRDLTLHLDFAQFQERLIEDAIARMSERMAQAGMKDVPLLHNVALGDGGQPISLPRLETLVDLLGLDYYHAAREHRTIKRRTLTMTGSLGVSYAPEMGAGAPPWFTPLSLEDSIYCAMAACAYGLRGFNLYMAVDRDRWYGAPIDSHGNRRPDADAWEKLLAALHKVRFGDLRYRAEVALVVPREYARLSRATHALGPIGPASLEALGGTPVDGCREDDFGFGGPIQILWWRMLAKMSDALTRAGVPYVYVDSDAPEVRLDDKKVIVAPTYEFAHPERWQALVRAAEGGSRIVYGPCKPTLDARMHSRRFDPIPGGRRVLLDTPEDADALLASLADELDLARPFHATPASVETAVHEDENGPRVLFVMAPTSASVTAEVTLPEPLVLRDLMRDEELAGDTSVHIAMPGRTCRLFELRRRSPSDVPAESKKPSARRSE